ncbi:hypothetical protein KX928_13085 [Roseobacter sp. YSTF-M11]|uniref:Lipoprotein n=1 Tax=Roseobacter insulae TaxID=2859783 RepID=A0A9X1K3K4_9RHOB|nr:DUF6778 family protein [Roseobacter insulae]MBW4708717.1 hypothetical protein [Roseobacter insulae]
MKSLKLIATLAASAMIAGCTTTDIASRNAPYSNPAVDAAVGPKNILDTTFEAAVPAYNVTGINVIVPESLIVSEANSYYPSGDIVWREDPAGNRHEQVKAIFDTAMARGTADMKDGTPVVLDVQVMRFHALTEKTRYTIGGIHSITFGLSLRSAETGLLLGEPRVIKANLKGFGGERAIAAERQGQTQKVRITDHLAGVILTELAEPDGYTGRRLSLLARKNNF